MGYDSFYRAASTSRKSYTGNILDMEFSTYLLALLGIGTIPLVIIAAGKCEYSPAKTFATVASIQILGLTVFYILGGFLWHLEGKENFLFFYPQQAALCVPINSVAACALLKTRDHRTFRLLILLNALCFLPGWLYLNRYPDRPQPDDPFAPPRPPYVDRSNLLKIAI